MFKQLILILPFILTFSINAIGQKGIGLKIGVSNGWRVLTILNSDIYQKDRRAKESFLIRPEIQVIYRFPINEEKNLSIGLGFSELGYQHKANLAGPNPGSITNDFEKEIHRYKASFVRLPISISQYFGKNNRLEFQAGFSVLALVSTKTEYLLRNFVKTEKISTEDWSGQKNLQFALDAGIGRQFLSKKNNIISFGIETSFVMNGYENTHISETVYNIGRYVNRDKTTKEHLIRFSLLFKYIL